MKAAIIIIGDEILLGRVVDTNSGFIAGLLNPMGITVDRIVTIGDNAGDIEKTVRELIDRYPLVLTTGGLGPTKDDITKKVLCDVFGGKLVFDADVMADVETLFVNRGLQMNELTRTQAMVPDSCRVVRNKVGTAPIMWFENTQGHVLVSMPGVPFETRTMMQIAVAPMIAERFSPDMHYAHRTLQTTGLSESALAERLDTWERQLPSGFHLAYLPDTPIIKLRLDGQSNDAAQLEEVIDRHFNTLQALCADISFATGEQSVAATLLERLRAHGYSAATAESCTGGNISHQITLIPGSSEVFKGAVVSYSNEVKQCVLGVKEDTLASVGAVSRETVEQMVAGVANRLKTDCAMATSGIAGPGGGTSEKPVGTVWIGARTPDETKVQLFNLKGSREFIIHQATMRALLMLIKML